MQYYEPANWVAKLRALKTDSNPLVFRVNMEASHGGKSGRFQQYQETAGQYAFMFWQAGLVPVYLLGLAQPAAESFDLVPLLLTVVVAIWGFYIHSNIKWRLGWFEWLVASPAFHHWHHTNDGPAVINKNYAPMLPWVDRIFGTLYLPKSEWPASYGIMEELPVSLTAGNSLDPVDTPTLPVSTH